MPTWEYEHRNASYFTSQRRATTTPCLPVRGCGQAGPGGSSPPVGPPLSLDDGLMGEWILGWPRERHPAPEFPPCTTRKITLLLVPLLSHWHQEGMQVREGRQKLQGWCPPSSASGRESAVGERVVTSCHTPSPPPSLLCSSCPSCSQGLYRLQIFIEHVLRARHQKYETSTVSALRGLPVQKAIKRQYCATGGPVSEHIHWDHMVSHPWVGFIAEAERGRGRGWRQLPKLTKG